MASDVPFVAYKNKKDVKSNSKRAMDNLSDRWHKKRAGEKSEKISLSEYMHKDILKS